MSYRKQWYMDKRIYRRKVPHASDLSEIGDEKIYVDSTMEIRGTETFGQSEKSKPTPISVDMKYSDEFTPDSLTSLVSIPLLDDGVDVQVSMHGDATEGWTEDATPKMLHTLITEVFSDFPDQYVVGRDMEARGYHVREDGAAVLIDSKIINKPKLDEITYFVTISDEQSFIKEELEELMQIRKKVDAEHPYSKDGFRIFTIGVISNSGQVYGLRVQYVPIDDKFRMHRMNLSENSRKVNNMWRNAKSDPKYRRSSLADLSFEVKEVYQ